MKIPDANVLLYAVDPSAAEHERARVWLEDALSGAETVGFAWVVLLAVLRLTTNSVVHQPALSAAQALDLIEGWLARPVATIIDPGPHHIGTLRTLLSGPAPASGLTTDAHLAALAVDSGAVLASFDSDFHRFGDLRFDYLGGAGAA